MNASSCAERRVPTTSRDRRRAGRRRARCRRARRLRSRGTRRRCGRPTPPPRPRRVSGAGRFHEWLRTRVERLRAQVERREHDVGAVDRVVVAARRRNGDSASSDACPAGPCPQSCAGGGRRGERHVEPGGPGDADRHLGHLDGVGEPGAQVVVVGGDEHLALAGQPAEGPRVLDAVEVALEARAEGVGLLGHGPVAARHRPGGARRQRSRAPASSRAPRSRSGVRGRRPRRAAWCAVANSMYPEATERV